MNNVLELIQQSSLPADVKAALLELAKQGPSIALSNAIEETFRREIDSQVKKAGVDVDNNPELAAATEAYEAELAEIAGELDEQLAEVQQDIKNTGAEISKATDELSAENIRSTFP